MYQAEYPLGLQIMVMLIITIKYLRLHSMNRIIGNIIKANSMVLRMIMRENCIKSKKKKIEKLPESWN
jgi:hypothetical protein